MVEHPLETTPKVSIYDSVALWLGKKKWCLACPYEGSMNETITFPFTEHGTGELEKHHFSPPQKKRFWIRSLTRLSVIINVLYCIVMYCQCQLAEVFLMRHLWRAIFKKSAITAWCCSIYHKVKESCDLSIVGGTRY